MNEYKQRAAQLLGELLTSLKSFVKNADMHPFDLLVLEPSASYLRDLGYKPDAERLEKDGRDLVNKVMDIGISEMAKGASPEEQIELAERFGAYPVPTDNDEVMQDRHLVALGQASNMLRWLTDLRASLEERANEIETDIAKRVQDTAYMVPLDGMVLNNIVQEDAKPKQLIAKQTADSPSNSDENTNKNQVKKKRSTAKGDAQAKILATFTKHHNYQDGSCLNQQPIGVNELARSANVAPSSVTAFFNTEFGVGQPKKDGHKKYMGLCQNTGNLVNALKLLNREYSPSLLYGHRPTDEGPNEDGE